jgi:hypothetical protein
MVMSIPFRGRGPTLATPLGRPRYSTTDHGDAARGKTTVGDAIATPAGQPRARVECS